MLNDGDFLRMSVDAEGDGYVVVADGMQTDWVATVDGQPAELLDADHAGVAVARAGGSARRRDPLRAPGPAGRAWPSAC